MKFSIIISFLKIHVDKNISARSETLIQDFSEVCLHLSKKKFLSKAGLETGNRFFLVTGYHDYFLDWYPLPNSRVSILSSGYQLPVIK